MSVRIIIIALSIILTSSCRTKPFTAGSEAGFYVSTTGNNSWSGRLPAPNTRGDDGPFATLEKARDAIRSLKEAGPLPQGGVTVDIRGGIYPISETFQLTSEDSGTKNAPVTWRAYRKEKVCFTGGKALTGFEPVNDPVILKRMDKAGHGKILKTDLKARGITNYGEIDRTTGRKMELFFNGKYMPIARYPNKGWLHIADVPQHGDELINRGRDAWKIEGIPRGRHYGRFAYAGDRPSRWSDVDDIYIHGYWVYDWWDEVLKIKSINTNSREIYPQSDSRYGFQKDARYYFMNILEELDSPGEWYLDKQEGILYFWPPADIKESKISFPLLDSVMVSLEQTSNVTFEEIVFESGRAGAIKIAGGSNNKIAGCSFSNFGNDAVVIEGGRENGIISCDIYEVAATGIDLSGGDRKTLTEAKNYATNNHIHRFARIFKTYRPGINLSGVGNIINHNLVHDAPHSGMMYSGNEHLFEFNEIHHVAEETGDVGAIYTVKDWTFCGNVIRHNYFHHIHGVGQFVHSKGIYLDLPVGGTTIYGNVFYDLEHGFFTNSGRHIVIENNIFIKCYPSVKIDVYRAPANFLPGGPWRLVEKLEEVNYKNPPYSTRYPWLPKILSEGDDPAIPCENVVVRNISYGGKWMDLHSELDFSTVTVKDNLIADPVICTWREQFQEQEKGFKEYKYGDSEMARLLEDNGNMVINTDPGFIDAAKGNFCLKDDSPAFKLGFKRIPVEKIGLYKDQYRTEKKLRY
ncbi:MAG: right-handed parallel beta-helix repeat-containing protein [Bacteroidota bacterium]